MVTVGGTTFGRATFQPGWRWSTCVKPLAGTQSCEVPHLQHHVAGRIRVVMDDGSEEEFGPGDVSSFPRGMMPGWSETSRRWWSISSGWRITARRCNVFTPKAPRAWLRHKEQNKWNPLPRGGEIPSTTPMTAGPDPLLRGSRVTRGAEERRLELMSQSSQLDRTFSFILKRMVETGQAPFYTEIAAELGVSVEEGRKALQDLLGAGIPAWVFPNTRLHRFLRPAQQSSHPVPDHCRWSAEVVRSVRV